MSMNNSDNFDNNSSTGWEDSTDWGNSTEWGNGDTEENSLDSLEDSTNFENEAGGNSSDGNETGGLKKTAIIMTIVGIVAIIVFIAVYKGVRKHDNNVGKHEDTISEQSNEDDNTNKKDTETQESKSETVIEEQDTWKEIDDNAELTNVSEVHSTFTVTSVNSYARTNGNEVEIKSVVKGSVAGFTGTYEIEVPYDKGIKLSIGNTFDVSVQIGEYEGKTVVENIAY